jgi:hypothetical protein
MFERDELDAEKAVKELPARMRRIRWQVEKYRLKLDNLLAANRFVTSATRDGDTAAF